MGFLRFPLPLSTTCFLVLLSSPLFATPFNTAALQSNLVNPAAVELAIQAGCSFLTQLYNSTLHLVKETPGSNSYHISSDNLLAQQGLSYCNQPIRRAIQVSLRPYKNGTDMMHEALLGLSIPLPIHNATVYPVANGLTRPLWQNSVQGNYTVDWEVHNSTGVLRDADYADVAAYTALELHLEENSTGASYELGLLNKDYDGKGMVDTVYTSNTSPEHGIYQTYKTALYLTVLNTLNQPIPPTLVPTILQTQEAESTILQAQVAQVVAGGFRTGYNATSNSAGTQANVETTSIVILALESFPPGPTLNTSSWDSGYQGDSFFIYYTLTNNETKWLNITSTTVTIAGATFSQPLGREILQPGPGEGIGFSIPIPNRASIGNHTLTLTANYQYYDNVSSKWLPASPVQQTATLIVRPFPELNNGPALLAAIATASLGLFLSLRPFSVKRLSEAVSRKPLSLGRTISLLLITVLTFYLFSFHSLDYRFAFLILFPPAALAVLLVIALGEANFARKRYKPAILVPLVLLSLGTTLASSINVAVYRSAGSCYSGLRGAGFPLPWLSQAFPYLGPSLPVPFSCPFFVFQWWSLTPVYFLLDTALYTALGIGIVEAYRRFQQRHVGGPTSSIERVNGQGSSVQVLAALYRPDKLISRRSQEKPNSPISLR